MSGTSSPDVVEQWILFSASPQNPSTQLQATHDLQDFLSSSSPVVASTLLTLLTSSQHETVVFYALSELARLVSKESGLVAYERNQLLNFLLSSSGLSTSFYLRNKAALVLATLALTSRWESFESDLISLSSTNAILFLQTLDTVLELMVSAASAEEDNTEGRRAPQSIDLEAVRRMRAILKRGTAERFCDRILLLLRNSSPLLNSSNTSSGSTELIVLALKTVQGFFLVDLGSISTPTVNHVLEYLLAALQPHCDASIQLAALQVWGEWIHSTVAQQANATTSIDTGRSTTNESPPSTVLVFDDRHLDILGALLEKVHVYDLLPVTGESKAEIEVVIEIAKLVCNIGLEVLPVWCHDQPTTRPSNAATALLLLQTRFNQILDLFFRAFAYDDIDVSTAVLPLAAGLVKTMGGEKPKLQQHLPQMLNILYQQLKYPPDYNHDSNDDLDAEEQLYRVELGKLFTRIVRVQPNTCLQFLCEASSQWLPSSSTTTTSSSDNGSRGSPATKVQDVEATLSLVYHYCEGVHPPPGVKTVLRDTTFCSLLVAIHSADIVGQYTSFSDLLCLYYDLAVRYAPIFQDASNAALLSLLLEALSGTHGLQHPSDKVRSRCCFLLLRLVTVLASRLRPFVETAVTGIQHLLQQAQSHPDLLRVDDMMYLFETIGILVGKTGVDELQQVRYLSSLLTPHVRAMDEVLAKPDLTRDAHMYGELLACSISAMAHLSKGFSKQPPAGVQCVLLETLRSSLRVLETLPTSDAVRNKTMVLLQRMILCLGDKVLPFIPSMLYPLITHCTSDDILFVSQVFIQLCIKFKQAAIPAIDASLLPFLRQCHSVIPQTETDVDSGLAPHLHTEQLSIQKLAYAVLQAIVANQVTAVLLSPTNVNSLEVILRTMNDGAVRVRDGVIQRTCIKFFREMVQQWGDIPAAALDNRTEISNNNNGGRSSNSTDLVYRRGFMTFTIQVFLVEIVQTVLDPTMFNPQDANQARCLAELSYVLFGCLQYDQESTMTALLRVSNASAEFRLPTTVEQVDALLRRIVAIRRDT